MANTIRIKEKEVTDDKIDYKIDYKMKKNNFYIIFQYKICVLYARLKIY